MLSIFSCAFWPSVCLLWRLLPILILSCMSCSYILELKALSIASFANIFSHSIGCLCILFMVSFAVQKLSSLIRSHLFIFVFIFFTLGDGSKKILLRFMPKSVLPMFSSKSFIILLSQFFKAEIRRGSQWAKNKVSAGLQFCKGPKKEFSHVFQHLEAAHSPWLTAPFVVQNQQWRTESFL